MRPKIGRRYSSEIEVWYRLFFCPCCEGEGSWTDIIEWEIGGPTERCGYCDGSGRIGLGKLLLWVCSVDIFDHLRTWWKYGRNRHV